MEDLYGENTHEKIGGEDLSDENTRRKSVVVAATAHVAAAATAIATTCLLLNIPREPRVNRDNERQSYIDSILLNEQKCRANLQMGIDAFHRLCDLIREQGILKESQICTLEEMVMRFLHLLGHNVRHRVLEGRFWRSRETISRQFNETLDCVVKLYKLLIADHLEVVHGSGLPPEISNDPRFASYLNGCIGALDGTHIIATVPVEEQERFRGRKTKSTQNVLAACSFDLKFTYVLAGWEGTAHDQKVLDDALTHSNALVIPPGKYYLVDAGYTHQPSFLALYRGNIYHVSEHKGRTPKNEKELFNKRHSHLRSTIERAFGVLKNHWPMLSTDFFYPFKTQVKMALACFILHNHIMGVDPNDPLIVEATEELEEIDDIEGFIDALSTSNASQARWKAAWVQFRNDIALNMYRDYRSRRNL